MTDGETNLSAEPAPEKPNPADGKMAKLVYILFLFSILFSPLVLVGIIIAYVQKGTEPEWLESHYRFQIRTFWIIWAYLIVGGIVFGGLSTVSIFFAFLGILFGIYLLVWWPFRCIRGYKRVSRAWKIANPASWTFGG